MKNRRWLASAVASMVSLWLVTGPGVQAKDRLKSRTGSHLASLPGLPEYVSVIQKAFGLASYWQLDQAMAQFDQYLPIQGEPKAFRAALSHLYPTSIKSDGIEIPAIRKVSPRIHIVYVLVYLESGPRLVILRTYRFEDDWRIVEFQFDADMALLDAESPVTRVPQDLRKN